MDLAALGISFRQLRRAESDVDQIIALVGETTGSAHVIPLETARGKTFVEYTTREDGKPHRMLFR